MKISSIHIENFRGIESLTLTDLSYLTVITGTNGSGKSAVLNAITILVSWLVARIRSPRGLGLKIEEGDITIGRDYCYLEICLDNGVSWSLYKQRTKVSGQINKVSDKKTNLTQMNKFTDQIAEGMSEESDITMFCACGVNRISDVALMI